MTSQIPRVGDVVHYVSYGTPGGEYGQECRAAIVTEVDPLTQPDGSWSLGLCVLNPTCQFFNRRVLYNDGAEVAGSPDCPDAGHHGDGPFRYCACGWTEPSLRPGTWHWPERV